MKEDIEGIIIINTYSDVEEDCEQIGLALNVSKIHCVKSYRIKDGDSGSIVIVNGKVKVDILIGVFIMR